MDGCRKANRRPLAIMMSNDKAALPQYGINHAGVVYEAPVEGSMNRYMALIEDYDDLVLNPVSVRLLPTSYFFCRRQLRPTHIMGRIRLHFRIWSRWNI